MRRVLCFVMYRNDEVSPRGREMQGTTLRETLRITKALADTQRLRILMLLRGGELCVCQIVEVLGLAPSTVSRHLSLLSAVDLVVSRKDGRWAYYRLPATSAPSTAFAVQQWLATALERDISIRTDQKKLRIAAASDPDALCRQQRERQQ